MLRLFTFMILLSSFYSLHASFVSEDDFQRPVTFLTTTTINVKGLKDKVPTIADTQSQEDLTRFKKVHEFRLNKINAAITDISLFQNETFHSHLKNVLISNSHFDVGDNLGLLLASIKKLNLLTTIHFNQTYFGTKAVSALISQLQGFPVQIWFTSCFASGEDTLEIRHQLPYATIQ